jgi:hypothetical protein
VDRIEHRSKLHLRVRQLGGQELRLLTPRPGTDLLLSDNYYHDTWHIVTDTCGSRQLAHLLWALSYQQRPGTVLLLDEPFVVSSPFDGDRARPVLFVLSELGGLTHRALEALQAARHRLGPPDGTVRIDTRGLPDEWEAPPRHVWRDLRESMTMRGGFVEYRADRTAMRQLAMVARWMTASGPWSTYHYLADSDGELQLYEDFRARVRIASRVRFELGLQPGFATPSQQPLLWDATNQVLWRQERARRAAARTARPAGTPARTAR